jgi:hypothetical protein
MKRLIAMMMVVVMLGACGRPATLQPEGKPAREYPTIGIFSSASQKSSSVCYEVSIGNVVWSILLLESVVFPLYFIGWSLYNPVSLKRPDGTCPGIDG